MAKRMRNPNGYGSIVKLSGKRRNPYMVKVNTHMDERYYPVYDILGYYPTWADASIALAKYNDDPYDISAAHMTFAQLYKYYYDDKYVYASKKLSKSSMYCTQMAYRYCAPLHNQVYSSLRTIHFQRILDTGKDKDGKPFSHSVQEHILNLMRQMDTYGIGNGIIKSGYATYAKIKIDDDDEQGVPFTDEELRLLWSNKDIPFVDTILIYCYSGWRINELGLMPLKNIDLENWTFTGGLKTRCSKNRYVPIHSAIQDMVRNRYHPEFKSLIYHNGQKNISESDYRDEFNRALLACGIAEPHTPHDCRHTFNELLRKAKADDTCRYKMMGHAGRDINQKVYTHLTVDDLRPEIEKIQIPTV